MTTKVFTAKEAKNNFGRLLDEARDLPVIIKKNNRNVAVIMSMKEYEALERAEDAVWGKMAMEAHKEGYIGVLESEKLIRSMLND